MFGKFLKDLTWRAGKEIKNSIRMESQKLKPTKYTLFRENPYLSTVGLLNISWRRTADNYGFSLNEVYFAGLNEVYFVGFNFCELRKEMRCNVQCYNFKGLTQFWAQ
jgi:hypothetical protein